MQGRIKRVQRDWVSEERRFKDEISMLRASCAVLDRRVAARDAVIELLARSLREERRPPAEACSDDVPF